ncbi:hypothetical protein SKAU_G00388920 [Synaphobranchus kaupii]|uniref:Spermatogenesis-associated protein 2 PUB-like domain-containing protein n=1 Tax=Synaphobranchus kaupii TaxID=118154 RepID=A0A9Q1ICK5_SYNKA|nr:hypothetical protein SKAU_G00388920 [Synaphobranchus kaupii]
METQNHRSKTGKRESYLSKLGRSSSGDVSEQYRVSLERRTAQGDIDLVCGDEELCERVERILREGDPRDVLTAQRLDALATMEDCLQAPPAWGRAVGGLTKPATAPGLGAIGRTFEVLERAALNLYLCPWRKEYRVVKIFSGMFTHLVRPALSEQQVDHLFGLLGYQNKGAELELQGNPPSPATLLSLACAFFAARCESRLLSRAAAESTGGAGAELTLVRERQKGRSLQEALESLREKVSNSEEDMEVDLYTAEGKDEGETGVGSAGTEKHSTAHTYGESVSLLPAGDSSVSAPNQRICLTLKSQQRETRSLGPDGMPAVSQTAADGGMGMALGQNQACACLCFPDVLWVYHCQQCCEIHYIACDIVNRCRNNKHDVQLKKVTELSGPAVGGASAEPSKESREGRASAAARDRPKEGGASTALSVETKAGGDSATAWDRPKLEKTREVKASGTHGPGLNVQCEARDCQNLSRVFCKSCRFRICEKCLIQKQTKCGCGHILLSSDV